MRMEWLHPSLSFVRILRAHINKAGSERDVRAAQSSVLQAELPRAGMGGAERWGLCSAASLMCSPTVLPPFHFCLHACHCWKVLLWLHTCWKDCWRRVGRVQRDTCLPLLANVQFVLKQRMFYVQRWAAAITDQRGFAAEERPSLGQNDPWMKLHLLQI